MSSAPPQTEDEGSNAGLIDQIMEICGCSREAAQRAAEAAGPGGVELAVDLVLSTQSAHWASASDVVAPPRATKLVCLVR